MWKDLLPEDELEGVIAYKLTHLANDWQLAITYTYILHYPQKPGI